MMPRLLSRRPLVLALLMVALQSMPKAAAQAAEATCIHEQDVAVPMHDVAC
jgi:hypothetical protein